MITPTTMTRMPLRHLVRLPPASLVLATFTSPCAAVVFCVYQPSRQPTARKMTINPIAAGLMRQCPQWPLTPIDHVSCMRATPAETPGAGTGRMDLSSAEVHDHE